MYALGFKGVLSWAGRAVYKLGRFFELIKYLYICNVKQWYPAKKLPNG